MKRKLEELDSYSEFPRKRTFYDPDPDYTRTLYDLPPETRERMAGRLRFLYGERLAEQYMPELERILRVHHAHKPPEMIEKEKTYDPKERFSEKDMILIAYGDIVKGHGQTPLSTLHDFVNTYNRGAINTLHLLPFFPYSSDRGFAVVDFRLVDPKLGTWADIREKKRRYDLMFDAVLNHVSSRSVLFREFLNGNPRYKDFFIAYDSPDDLTPEQRSKIFRPRTSDILTRFDTIDGPKWVWTTFSEDQIDFNFRNPEVLLQVTESLLFYIRNGADILRLDAVTYLWAEPGTESVHLPQTHEVVKLLRDVVDSVGSGVALVTETNVPHEKNISYFGNGRDEAHMVYNFALPALVLHAFYREDSRILSKWAEEIKPPSDTATFLNILDTHDGIGLMGAKEILSKEDVTFIIKTATERGACISYKMAENRAEEPYEINTTWWSAVNEDDSPEDLETRVKRFVATRSIALVIQGVPGIYVHGFMGTANDHERVKETGVKRDVNRGFISREEVEEELTDPDSKLSLIRLYSGRLNLARTGSRAFHPRGGQKILHLSPQVFAVLRRSPEEDEKILTLTNVTGRESKLSISLQDLDSEEARWKDLLSDGLVEAGQGVLRITLEPYGVIWLTADLEGAGDDSTL
ncbi:MAG TPA: sugar phosphorylase [Desulfobacteraceae bacterium]|nr:sugar phosphorylase [Desulfobacteraceae bacterium]